MDTSPEFSSIAKERAPMAPRAASERPQRSRKKERSSLDGQRFYPPATMRTMNDEEHANRNPKKAHLLTWQEFVKDAFKSTVSLGSLVSWHEVLCSSPPPPPPPPPQKGADGPPGTPPEVLDKLEAEKKGTMLQKFRKGIQVLRPRRKRSDSSEPANGSGSENGTSFRIFGKSKTIFFTKPTDDNDGNGTSRRRLSFQPKFVEDWSSKAQKWLGRKGYDKGKGAAVPSNPRESDRLLSSSGSSSPSSQTGLLNTKNRPSKIVVRRASKPQNLPSLFSSPSESVGSLTESKPVTSWSFLSPPETAPSPKNTLQLPLDQAQIQAPQSKAERLRDDQNHASMDMLFRHHSSDEVFLGKSQSVGAPSDEMLQPRLSIPDSVKSHETLWRRSFSSPSISSSFSSLSMIPGVASRSSSIWDYRASVTSIPRGSTVSIQDVKRALRANLTGQIPATSINEKYPPHPSSSHETTILRHINNTPTHTHVGGMFSSSGHVNHHHVDVSHSPTQSADTSRPSTSHTVIPGRDGRRPSIVRKDHMEIYSHPYFDVAPYERHRSLSSTDLPARNRPEDSRRRSTMESTRTYRTALDGTEGSSIDVSFVSF